MPRAGWLALGGVIAAIGTAAGAGLPVGGLWVAFTGLAATVVVALGGRHWRVAALAIGAASVLARVALGAALAGPPPDPGPVRSERVGLIARVLTVGGNREGSQRATLEVRLD